MGMIPSITGKVELVYEGEQEGSSFVANQLISEATKTLFLTYFPKIEKLKKADQVTPYDGVVEWFTQNNALEIADETDEQTYLQALQAIEPLKALIERYQPRVASEDLPFLMEFVLWALVEFKRLSKQKTANGMSFNDLYDSLLRGI